MMSVRIRQSSKFRSEATILVGALSAGTQFREVKTEIIPLPGPLLYSYSGQGLCRTKEKKLIFESFRNLHWGIFFSKCVNGTAIPVSTG
jgi:hypothetical protein